MRWPGESRRGLAGRLMAALTLVVVAGGITAWIVAGAVGPAVFHEHMVEAGVEAEPMAVMHAEEAFQSASALALAIALAASVVASLAVSLFLTRRIASSLGTLSAATTASRRGISTHAWPVRRSVSSSISSPMRSTTWRASSRRATRCDSACSRTWLTRSALLSRSSALPRGTGGRGGHSDAADREGAARPGTRLARLAADLAAVTKAEQGARNLVLAPTSPDALLTTAFDAAKGRYVTAGVDLTLNVEPGLPTLAVDADRMSQVLGNLLDNALRHTPQRIGAPRWPPDGGPSRPADGR